MPNELTIVDLTWYSSTVIGSTTLYSVINILWLVESSLR